MEYLNIFAESTKGTLNWVWKMMIFHADIPWYQNYFYGIILISLAVWALELIFPWRRNQSPIRKDFWLDGFYIFFNMFIFAISFYGFYEVFRVFVEQQAGITMSSLSLMDLSGYPQWLQLLIFFVLTDFIQWATHVALHKVPAFWRFHQVHHSVREMGFAAHMRYHWMENILYKPGKTLIIMVLGGFEPEQAFIVHFFAILIGHLNHANVRITWGPLKYVFNNSVMHLYHHAKNLPNGQRSGVNFGISLSLWDYIFRTNYIPQSEDGSYELGFEHVEEFPETFIGQATYGFGAQEEEKKALKES